jgi:hypothetical protein
MDRLFGFCRETHPVLLLVRIKCIRGDIDVTSEPIFPSLAGFEPTRQTLQLYSRVITAVPRAHGQFHPKWWHISLKVQPDGLITDKVALPSGRALHLKMDLQNHEILLILDGTPVRTFSMTGGKSSTALAEDVLAAVAELGLTGKYDREKFENDGPREYDRVLAGDFLTGLINADRIFKQHRATLSGETGPVQLWPHGFDLAFEWFGTRVQVFEDHGERKEFPSQLNLGFFPGGHGVAPYFYSNPWPFESDALLGQPLPEGARWHTEGWQGTLLPYESLAGDPNAEERVLAYARRVFELAAPTLMAEW